MIKSSQVNLASWSQWLTTAIGARFGSGVKHSQVKASARPLPESKSFPLTLTASTLPGQPTLICLTLAGALNRHTYLTLVESACAHHAEGKRTLLLDLGQTTVIELSGLFALMNIARLYSGQSLLDPDDGWDALHTPFDAATQTLSQRVKLVAPSSQAVAALERASFCRCFEHYANLESAIAAC